MRIASPATCLPRASSCSAPRLAPLIVVYVLCLAGAALGGAGLDPRHMRAALTAPRTLEGLWRAA
eukprot:1031822-Alexandrium_andersonii.AAC.1